MVAKRCVIAMQLGWNMCGQVQYVRRQLLLAECTAKTRGAMVAAQLLRCLHLQTQLTTPVIHASKGVGHASVWCVHVSI
jgi:hypothetical protein